MPSGRQWEPAVIAESAAGSQLAARNSKFFAAYFWDREGARNLAEPRLFQTPAELSSIRAGAMADLPRYNKVCVVCVELDREESFNRQSKFSGTASRVFGSG